MLNIVIFKGGKKVLDYFIDRFIEQIEKKGIDCYVADVREPQTYRCSQFESFISRKNVCVLAFNDLGINLTEGGVNTWASRGIPVFTYIVDHPRNYDDAMLHPVCDLYVLALDKEHVDFIKRFYPDVKDAFFSPNGGTELDTKISYRDRKIDVLYMGNCQPEITYYPPLGLLDDKGISFYRESIGELARNPMLSTETVIMNYLDSHQIAVSDEQLFSIISKAALYIETTVRRHFKQAGMHALDDAGVAVDIYGEDWESDIPYSDNIRIHPRIDIDEMMNLIPGAKISLCYIPWYKKGCSEKNFDSILNGALCVSDRSEYLDTNYTDGYNIVYFDLNNPTQMALDVKWLLEHPAEAETIAQRGYETAAKYDTWYNRCDYVLEKMCHVVSGKS